MSDVNKTTGPVIRIPTKRLVFEYHDHKNKPAIPETKAIETTRIRFGLFGTIPRPQWIISGVDLSDGKVRDFAMSDMREVSYAE